MSVGVEVVDVDDDRSTMISKFVVVYLLPIPKSGFAEGPPRLSLTHHLKSQLVAMPTTFGLSDINMETQ